ncbi:MAG TPA: pseudouridine synthase [bacterium]|nr:pseudouridine synthase [bacterium]
MEERLQKTLARAGLGARRKCEQLIVEGRVVVNGSICDQLGAKVDPAIDRIEVDGAHIRLPDAAYIVMFNKPAGSLTTMEIDRNGRETVMDYFRDFPVRIFPVGRLDFDTEGLLLLTNDGAFSQRVTHPSQKVFKTYEALIYGTPEEWVLDELRKGVCLDDGMTSPARARLISIGKTRVSPRGKRYSDRDEKKIEIDTSLVEISIREGKKRQVRRMLRAMGHNVIALKRIAIGSLKLGDLPLARYRILSAEEAGLAFEDAYADSDR